MSVRGSWWRMAALMALAVAGVMLPLRAVSAATVTISGFVYWDRNDNGVRDAGEPGVAGIRVRHGSGSVYTVTAADGSYTLTNVPTSGNMTVETGWFRSQCPPPSTPTSITCPAGPGPDNDFEVDNQFLRHPMTGATNAANVDVGLLPDWPGDALLPAGDPVPANAVDVAARLSWVSGACAGGAYNICKVGDSFILNAQVYNQGTTALTGIVSKLVVPAGDCLTGLSLTKSGTSPGITAIVSSPATFTCATSMVTISLTGTLVPGGAALISVKATTQSGPGTPGCVPAKIVAPCTKAEPAARGWLFGVSHIDQAGDPDSDFCMAGNPAACPTGLHDKRRNPDEVDPVGHNVDASLGGTTAVDLQTFLAPVDLAGSVHPGDTFTLRAWAANELDGQPANQINAGATVTVYLPMGSTVAAPPVHALLSCVPKTVSGAVAMTCTNKGPLSPGLSGVALNLTVTVPATWPVGTPLHAVACGLVPSAQAAAERVPAGSSCSLTTDAATTATNNDAEVDIPVS